MTEKIRLEDLKEFKIERKVFDDRTLFAIYKLMTKGFIKSVESEMKEGKESLILSAKNKDGNWLALKVYRVEYCDFKSMWKYLVGDSRFLHVKKNRRAIVLNWCKREFKNLRIAFDAGVNCPEPIAFYENVLVMSFIGEGGELSPRLIDVDLENPQDAYDLILEDYEKMLKAGLIHTDLSAFNILIWDKPYFIDFSQAVPVKHQLAKEFLMRDLKNLNNYFNRLRVKIIDKEQLFKKFVVWLE